MTTRRQALEALQRQPSTHPGLWIDKFLSDATDRTDKRGAHLAEMSQPNTPEGYRLAFERRRDAFLGAWQPEGALIATGVAEIEGRMIIGLGQKGVMEAGITLDHTWGIPFLPGSALKGIAARAAMQLVEDEAWRRDGESFDQLFGTTDAAGAVVFHDAWWRPRGSHLPLHADVMTVHHPEYYQGDGETPPSDTDSPNPVSFLSVSGGFEVMLEGPEVWVEAASTLLALGLDELGIGAKTNAGYGRARLDFEPIADQRKAREALREQAELASLSPHDRFLREVAPILEKKTEAEQRDALLQLERSPNWISLEDYRAEIYAVFGELIARLRASIDDPNFGLEALLERIKQKEEGKPKDKKKVKSWRKGLDKAKKSLEQERKRIDKTRKNARSWLDWLGMPS